MWGTTANAEQIVIWMMQTIVKLWKKAELDARNAEVMMQQRLKNSREELHRELGRSHNQELATHETLQLILAVKVRRKTKT